MAYNKTATFNVQAVLQSKDKGFSSSMKKASVDAEHLNKNMHGLGLAFQKVGMSGIGRGFGDLKNALRFLVSGNISQGMSSIGRSLEGFNSMGGGIIKTFAVAAAAVGGFIAMGVKGIQTYAALGESIAKIGFVSGINPEAATNLYAQFKMTGVDAEAGSKSIAMFTKNLYKARSGVGAQAGALKDLGVNLKTSTGEWKTASELLPEVRKRLSETKDSSLKAGVAMALFSRGWQVLGRWISTDEKAIQSYNDIVKKSGFKFDVGGYNEFITSQRKVSLTWALMWAQIGKIMSPAMTAIAGFIGTWGPRAIKMVTSVGKVFSKAFGFLGPVPGLILALAVPLGALALIFTKSVQSAQAFKGALKTMGWAGETAAIDADTAALVANNAARAGGSLGGMGAPYASPRMNRQADLNAAFKAQDLSAMQKAGSAAGLAPTLGTIGTAEKPVSRLGLVAAKTGGAFRSMGAGIAASVVSLGTMLLPLAAIGIAIGAVALAYHLLMKGARDAAKETKKQTDDMLDGFRALQITAGGGIKSPAVAAWTAKQIQGFHDLTKAANDAAAARLKAGGGGTIDKPVIVSGGKSPSMSAAGAQVALEAAKAATAWRQAGDAMAEAGNIIGSMNFNPQNIKRLEELYGVMKDIKEPTRQETKFMVLLGEAIKGLDPYWGKTQAEQAQIAKDGLKAAADALAIINVQIAGMSGPVGMTKDMAMRAGYMEIDPKTGAETMLKGATIVEDIQKTAADVAAAAADAGDAAAGAALSMASSLAAIPKNIVKKINKQDWFAVGVAVRKAMDALLAGMAPPTTVEAPDMPHFKRKKGHWVRTAANEMLGGAPIVAAIQQTASDVGNTAASAALSMASALAGIPKNIIKKINKQDWFAVGVAIREAMDALLAGMNSASNMAANLASALPYAGRFKPGQEKMKYPTYASGADFVTRGTTPMIAGEAGPERVQITPLTGPNARHSGGDVHLHIGNLVGTDERAARQLADMVGRHLMRGVSRGLVGQNA